MHHSLSRFFVGARPLFELTFRLGGISLGAALTTSGLLVGLRRGGEGWFAAIGRWN